jgi:uncharacterized protein (TIGR03435 family)
VKFRPSFPRYWKDESSRQIVQPTAQINLRNGTEKVPFSLELETADGYDCGMQALRCLTLLALLAGAAFGQITVTPPPAFEVADVHVSATTATPFMRGGVLRGSRYEMHTATMLDLIRTAYGVDAEKVVGGPNWLESDRFDVIAKAPASATPETAKLMLQALLADRFKLVVHTDSKPIPVFVLAMGKGKPKLKEAADSGKTGCEPQQQNPEPGTIPQAILVCRNITMEAFAQVLRGMAGAYMTSPVVDSTGLKGNWDFDIKWTARALLPRAGADGITIFDAVDKQLGLKLESQKVPAQVIVVDSVNQKPTENPSGVTQLAPAAPSEFEVAEIKPSAPGAMQNGRMQNGRLDLQAFPLKMLIQVAWSINGDEMLAGVPKWMESARFDVIAKASTSGPDPQVDIDALRLMLRALLEDRFKLKTHTENRPLEAYTLTAVKPKLKKADPSNRTSTKEGPAPGAKDPRETNPVLNRVVTFQNTTMAQFAEQLQRVAGGYIHSPVMDATGSMARGTSP